MKHLVAIRSSATVVFLAVMVGLLAIGTLVGAFAGSPSAWAAVDDGQPGASPEAASRSAVRIGEQATTSKMLRTIKHPGSRGPVIEIEDMDPAILVNEETVRIRVHLAGVKSSTPLRLAAFVRADPFEDMSSTDEFLDGHGRYGWSAGELTLTQQQTETASGEDGLRIDFELNAQDLPMWNPSAWGPYGVEIRALGTGANFAHSDTSAYGLLLWYPEGAVGETRLNLLLSGPEDRWSEAMPAIGARVGLTYALTPTQIRMLADAPNSRGTEVVVVPEESADLSMLAAAKQYSLYKLAAKTRSVFSPAEVDDRRGVGRAESTDEDSSSLDESVSGVNQNQPERVPGTQDLGGKSSDGQTAGSEEPSSTSGASSSPLETVRFDHLNLIENAVIATEGWLSLDALNLVEDDPVLSSPDGIPEQANSRGTPTSKVMISATDGQTLPSTTRDPAARVLLDSYGPLAEIMGEPASSEADEFRQNQRIRALTALATLEDIHDFLYLWANINYAAPSADLETRIDAALDAPWIVETPLSALLRGPASSVSRETIGEVTHPDAAATIERLTDVTEAVDFATAVVGASPNGANSDGEDDPLRPYVRPVLATAAAGLTLEERTARVDNVVQMLTEQFDVIQVAPTRTVNVMNRNAEFPVTLTNIGDFPVKALVSLEAEDARLQAPKWVEVTIPAKGNVVAQIPIVAVGSGDVKVLVTAKTDSGTILDASQLVDVRVRAGLEDTLTWVVAIILGLLFLVGLIRTLRKGRRKTPAAANTSTKYATSTRPTMSSGPDTTHSLTTRPRAAAAPSSKKHGRLLSKDVSKYPVDKSGPTVEKGLGSNE